MPLPGTKGRGGGTKHIFLEKGREPTDGGGRKREGH